jgi:PAS domain S-box-containing protein
MNEHQQLGDNSRNFQAILEKTFEGLLTTDFEGRITYSCPSTSEWLGFSKEDFLDMNFFSLLHPEDVDDFKTKFSQFYLNHDLTLIIRSRLKVKDAGYTWVETRVKNLLEDPQVNSMVYQLTNVTEVVNKEHQQEDFVNIASHELKNPITALHGYMHLLKMRVKDGNEDLKKVISRMDAQLYKMQNIIAAMLDNTKIKAGEVQYSIDSFDLNECIQDTVDAVKINTDSHEIHCNFESPKRIVFGDEEKISRVLTNLISNAIKYSPQGKTIELSTSLESNAIKVTVTDHGIGIAKEKQLHLFKRFYRVDTLPKHMSGLGLGLFISAEIINHHHGSFGVDSIEGDGSSFWFTIPLLADQVH